MSHPLSDLRVRTSTINSNDVRAPPHVIAIYRLWTNSSVKTWRHFATLLTVNSDVTFAFATLGNALL